MTKHLTTMAAALSLLVACSLVACSLVACSHDSAASGDHPLDGAGASGSGAGANGGGGAIGSAMTADSAGIGVSGANAGGAGSTGASGSSASGAGSAGTTAGGSSGSAGDGAAGSQAGSGGSAAGSEAPAPSDDAGVMAGDGAVRAIASPPTYQGNGNGGCTMTRQTTGFEPDDAGGAHPLFLYFIGTRFVDSDTSARYDSQAAAKITEAMARRGFVALSVDYDNSLSLSADKLSCVFSSSATTALSVACALPNVDCDLGIATWGHSQGALMAHASSNFDSRVRAVWVTGYSGGDYPLSDTRLRVVNGEGDVMNGNWSILNEAAGMSAAECPDDGRSSCLRDDGSGWILVRKSDCVASSADHCWFDRTSCGASAITLEPNWIDPASTKAFALDANADWVAATLVRP